MADKIDDALKAIKALESRVSALETQMKAKKDMKPEHELAIKAAVKQAGEVQAQIKDQVTKAVFEARLAQVEGMAKAALAAGKK
jgi:hypothetical protein